MDGQEVMIIAGEASGDLHAASLMRELQRLKPGISFTGIGGDEMMNEGFRPIVHIRKMAFLGFTEVLRHLPFINKVKMLLRETIAARKIKTVVLVDYPGFNLNFAKGLREAGIQVVYYISPQLWAWGKGRINKIRERVNKILVVFPFEETMYREAGIDAEFVGHPLVEQIANYPFLPKEELFARYHIPAGKEIVLVLPGSRKQEIRLLYDETVSAAKRFAAARGMQTVVARAPMIDEHFFSPDTEVIVTKDHVLDFMKHARVGVIKSGTSTLQAGLLNLPMVIVYKTSKLTYWIGRRLISIGSIGLANIVAGKVIVPELIQDDMTAEKLTKELDALLQPAHEAEIKRELSALREKLGAKSAAKNAALAIGAMIDGQG